VKDTQGVLLTWNNTVVPSYYSACCGGIAAAASDAISSSYLHNIPPLHGREGADVCTSLDVHQWKVKRTHESVKKRLAKWSDSLSNNPLNQLGSIESIIPTQTSKHGRPINFEIIDNKKNQHEITAKQLVRAMNTNYPTVSKPTPKVRSSCLVASRMGSDVEFRGVGMGHGVGLCQYGAQVLAGQNMSWESILEWYYPKALVSSVL
jgi:stage II sporulation protein D